MNEKLLKVGDVIFDPHSVWFEVDNTTPNLLIDVWTKDGTRVGTFKKKEAAALVWWLESNSVDLVANYTKHQEEVTNE